MNTIIRIIAAIIITIFAFNTGNVDMSNNDMSNNVSNDVVVSDVVENNNDIESNDIATRIDCTDDNETNCLRYVWVVGEDSYWVNSDGTTDRIPFLYAAYYMERGVLSLDYFPEWLEAFKAKVCAAENDTNTCMADIDAMHIDALTR